jgi:hypothetical protein
MGCLLGSQDGRSVDVANSFEIKFTEGDAGYEVDTPFLLKKQEQCEWGWARVGVALGDVCSGVI